MSLDPNSLYFTGFDDHFFAVPSSSALLSGNHSSPGYHVTKNEKVFRLEVDVPGMKPDDVTIELEHGGRVLHLSGSRGVKATGKHHGHGEYQFDKSFKLGSDLDTSKITAHLSEGVLILTIPKMEKVAPAARRIVIIQGEAPALMVEGEEK
jgi:HSP20 family protein